MAPVAKDCEKHQSESVGYKCQHNDLSHHSLVFPVDTYLMAYWTMIVRGVRDDEMKARVGGCVLVSEEVSTEKRREYEEQNVGSESVKDVEEREAKERRKKGKKEGRKEHFYVPEHPGNQCGDGEMSNMMSLCSHFQL